MKIIIYYIYTTYKNSVKFKLSHAIIGIWRKMTPFIDQKCTYEKVTNNLGRALPPLIWTKSKRTATFFVKPSLSDFYNFQLIIRRALNNLVTFWVTYDTSKLSSTR